MKFSYQTDRLLLEVLGEDAAPYVLSFYTANQEIFEPWEPAHCDNFFTLDYQSKNLAAEMHSFLHHKLIRYYMIQQGMPYEIIGTVSFTHLTWNPENSCRIGYRIAADAQRNGYAAEALSFLIPKLMEDLKIVRVEANIMPNNIPSIRLVEHLGFEYEGIARGIFEIKGKREDHLRYAYIAPGCC